MNEQFGEKVKAIFDSITILQAKDSELKRDNANINGDSPMGAMLQYGANTAKEYNLEYLIKPAIAELHRDGWIHIHDLDFYAWTTTCTQIELRKLFKNGFNTGHGHLRAPKSIGSYAALAAIAIQSNQNDQHGGQSVVDFDYAMAEGVRYTYQKYLKEGYEICERLNDLKDKAWILDYAMEKTTRDTYQAMDTQLLQYLKEDYYLWLKDSEHCMIIEDIKINADTEEGNHLIVTGRSLESILERRIIWGQRIFNGNLQNGIQTMLNECIISPSIADRKISNFVFVPSADPKITSLKIDNQYTGDCLYDVVKGLCEENNIGFKIVLTDENKFAFSLYAGVDRSYEQTENPYVVFSPNFENIINSNYYSSRASFRNVTLVAGEGEGAARRTAIVGSASGLDRRELFTDARDISSDTEDGTLSDAEYMAQLRTKGLKNLADHIVTTAFEGEVEVTQLFKYGEDFFIGDIVQIANEYGNEGSAYISELVISNSEEGLSIYPTFKTISK